MTTLDSLQSRLGYRFVDPQRLVQALTHRSMGGIDNERLEFLGDGLLNALIGEALYLQNPRHDEGALSRLRSSLVREATLCALARRFDLGPHLRLGESERKSGGQRRDQVWPHSRNHTVRCRALLHLLWWYRSGSGLLSWCQGP